jgi:hypothetical protein
MPALSAWTVRLALIYLLSGFSMGALMLAQKGISYNLLVWRLLGAHIEFLVMGWTVNLIFGVAYWILPRYPGGSRGSPHLPVLSVIVFNAGILAASAAAWMGVEVLLAGRILQLLGVVLFAASAWGRVRPTVVS